MSQYQAEQPDQFYHELPRGRYSNDPNRTPQTFNVYSRSNGEPTEDSYNNGRYGANVVDIEPKGHNNTNNQNQTLVGNSQQARLIELYTGNDGVSEIGQTGDQTNSQYRNAQYQDVGNVRARVVSVTPPPAAAIPTETVNHRRIVVSKPVTTVREEVEADNSTTNSQNENYKAYNQRNRDNSNFNGGDSTYQSNEGVQYSGSYRNENYYNNGKSNSGLNNQYQNGDNNANYKQNFQSNEDNLNYNGDTQTKNENYENSTPSGVYISTTPSTASQRIIYVQPVSQEFAQQKAVPPKKY